VINSIFNSTKKILGLDLAYTPFDIDVMMHINAVFAVLTQLGIGPEDGFFIESDAEIWDDFQVPTNQLHLVKTYIFLKVRMLFDPPTTSYLIDAMERQIKEYEWRLSTMRESLLPVLLDETLSEEEEVVW
jgi:hypothetical protein